MEKKQDGLKEPWLAIVLSFFITGIGQIYAGRELRGFFLILIIAVLICFSIWSLLSPNCDILVTVGLGLFYGTIWIWNLFDAHKCARQTNSKDFEIERKLSKDPWLALFLSKLIPGLGQIYIKKRFAGIVFIIAGLFLIAISVKYPFLSIGLWAFFSIRPS